MSSVLDAVPGAFLVISAVAFTAQTVTLIKIRKDTAPGDLWRCGLVRTVACRVFSAGLYIALGIAALLVPPATAGIAAFLCFGFTQCLYLASSVLDLRLKRKLSLTDHRGRHRKH